MQIVFKVNTIITAMVAVLIASTFGGCGQRSSLYLPTVLPLPKKQNEQTQQRSDKVKPNLKYDIYSSLEHIYQRAATPTTRHLQERSFYQKNHTARPPVTR